ncbi:MAG: ribbon-helix-helix domain-containing protein [Candidatus Methanomethylicia archaeon]
MKVICIRLPEQYVKAMDELIRIGTYPSRSEFIRAAIRDYLKKELEASSEFKKIIREI